MLEDAGFRIIVPAWWTPQGRRRVRIRLRSTAGKKARGAAPSASGLSLENLVQYGDLMPFSTRRRIVERARDEEWLT